MATAKAKNKHRARTSRMTADEKTTILVLSAKGDSVGSIAEKMGRSSSTISRFIAEMASTTVLAEATLKRDSIKLVERIIKKADVKESIDVLSRTNIGVLAPVKTISQGGGGIEVSVGVSSCGTVVSVKAGGDAQGQVGEGKGQQTLLEQASTAASALPEGQRRDDGVIDLPKDARAESGR